MDEFIAFLEAYISEAQRLLPELSDEEFSVIQEFIQEAMAFIESEQVQQPPQPPTPPPLPAGTELLWQLAGGQPDAFANYLRTVPDQALNQLLQDPDRLEQIVQDLHERFPPQEPIEVGGIEKAPLESSNVWGFNYDPDSKTLFVRFQGDGVYQYEGVPPYIYSIFKAGAVPAKTNGSNQYGRWWIGKQPSIGASLFALIKSGGYPYRKVA